VKPREPGVDPLQVTQLEGWSTNGSASAPQICAEHGGSKGLVSMRALVNIGWTWMGNSEDGAEPPQ
jgi:hypothetical protein